MNRAPPPGRRYGPYRVVRPIGAGAIGAVHAAVDERDGSAVALKVVPLDAEDPDARQRFLTEAGAAQRLHHADIVRTREFGVQGREAWLAMDLVAGTTLERYVQPARLLPEALALSVAERVALALAHAHAQGVVHRDVKPGNVLVDLPAGIVRLSDFGLARMADAARTRTGLVLGSPAYMAPEQLAGAPASAATDIYALGVTLFQLLTGRLPFAGGSLGDLLREVAQVPAPPLRSIRPGLPPALESLVASTLGKRAAERPASAERFARALAELRAQVAGA